MQLTVNKDKDKTRQITVEYPIYDNLQDNVKAHGEKVVNDMFVAKAKIAVSDSVVRPALKNDLPDKDIHEKVKAFKLGEKKTVKKSPKERALEQYDKLLQEDPEGAKEYLEELKKRHQQKK